MTDKEKLLLNTVLLELLPYKTRVAIDFKSYLEILPDDSPEDSFPYKGNLEFILKQQGKTIECISKEPHILYSYPCSMRFGMLRGYDNEEYGVPVEFIRPYLRPMSSMTEEEKETYESFITNIATDETGAWELTDWLNAHHFDYRGLNPMGLALEESNGMYNIK